MAQPLVFEYVIECEDPEAERERLLSTPATPQALKILAEADAMYRERGRASHDAKEEGRSR